MPTLSESPNKTTLRRLLDANNAGDWELMSKAIDEVFDPGVVTTTPLPIEATGVQVIREVFASLHRAFPDLHIAVEDLIEEGERVVSRQRVTGTHRGTYMGVPPTGRSVTYDEVFIFRFDNGRIVESWGVVDVQSQMRQLGLMPASRPPLHCPRRAAPEEDQMTTPFGPQLIGETEKTLNAVLRRILEDTGLTEPQWVTLRLAGQLDGSVDADGLTAAVKGRAHFDNAPGLVGEMAERGLLAGGRLSRSGEELVSDVQATIATETATIWDDLPDADVDAATRVLNEIVGRARRVLALPK